MTTRDELLAALNPVLEFVRGVDVTRPDDAARALSTRFPLDGDVLRALRAQVRSGVVAGWLCDRQSGDVKFSRVAKDAGGWSIDAVHMRGAGGSHTHPNGEVDLCFAVDGAPRFDGHAPGWTVYAPGSWHVPTVDGGAMDILYFLPGGAIRFEPKPGA